MLNCLSHEKETIIPTKLINDLREGNVMAWVGAGLSMGVGYPSWSRLVENIAENINNASWGDSDIQSWAEKNADSSPEWVAEVLATTNIKEYYSALKSEFNCERKQENFTHALLALLPFKGYITTNYDSLIEYNLSLFTNYEPIIYTQDNAINLLLEHTDKKFVYKVHGDIKANEKSIILTETDYYSLQRNEIYSKILSWLFSKHTLVSFGYSLRDRDFRAILNERYELFKGNCPPFYVFTSLKETCREEIECYRRKFNVHVVSISPEYNFEELSSTLLSMYCLCHRIESEHNSQNIVNLIEIQMNNQQFQVGLINDEDMVKAHRLLSVIKDPLEITELVSILSESDISTTSAYVELLCKRVDSKRVICTSAYDTDGDRISVAKLIKKNIDVIPIDDNPKFLSSYYKRIIDKYYKTLSYLLRHKESFIILITSVNELKRIVEYYKQQGLWREWLEIAKNAQIFSDNKLNVEILQSIAWIYFWTRDYKALEMLLKKNSHIDTDIGVNNYTSKLYYMTSEGLNKLVEDLSIRYDKKEVNYFDISLLGRAYARLSTVNREKRDEYLNSAEILLKEALDQAIKSKDMIEIAVQNWYLSLVLIDRGKVDEAKIHLAETKRLDENIMERKPGIAWLRVAEYRLALKNNQKNVNTKRNIAYNAMDKLGMKRIDEYLEKEYYF